MENFMRSKICVLSRKSLGVLIFEKQVIFSKNIIVPKWCIDYATKNKTCWRSVMPLITLLKTGLTARFLVGPS